MKLLVLSNVSGSVDRVVDLLEKNHDVVAKETSASNNSIIQTTRDHIKNGTYDQIIIIVKDPIAAGMALNKKEGVNAAVCGSEEDARLAKDNGANVIVIRDVNSDKLRDILGSVVGGANYAGKMMKIEAKMPEVKMPAFKMPELKVKIPQFSFKKNDAEEKEDMRAMRTVKKFEQIEEKEGRGIRSSNEDSLIVKIKDYLGII